MGVDDLLACMREAWEWARRTVDRIMAAEGSKAARRLLDDGAAPVPPPKAPSAAPLEDGSGRRRAGGREIREWLSGLDRDEWAQRGDGGIAGGDLKEVWLWLSGARR